MLEIGDVIYLKNEHYNRAHKITDARIGVVIEKSIFSTIFEIYFPTTNKTLKLDKWEIEKIEKWSFKKTTITLP